MVDISAVTAEARSYLGTKWRHRGRSRYGIDCIGLVVLAMKAGGFQMRDRLDYSRTPFKDGLEREMVEHFGSPVADGLQEGDVVLMRWDDGTEPSHVGLIVNGPCGVTNIIHSYSMVCVTEHCVDDLWKSRITAVFRPCKS